MNIRSIRIIRVPKSKIYEISGRISEGELLPMLRLGEPGVNRGSTKGLAELTNIQAGMRLMEKLFEFDGESGRPIHFDRRN